jgi:hypothetical protein
LLDCGAGLLPAQAGGRLLVETVDGLVALWNSGRA